MPTKNIHTDTPASPTVEKIKKYQHKAHAHNVIKIRPHYFDIMGIDDLETDPISAFSSGITLPNRYEKNKKYLKNRFKIVPVKPNSLTDATYISNTVSTCTPHKSGDLFHTDLYSECYIYVEVTPADGKNVVRERYIAYKNNFYLDNDQKFTTIEDYIPIACNALEKQTTITVKMFISQFYFTTDSLKTIFSDTDYKDIISMLEIVLPASKTSQEKSSDFITYAKTIKVNISSKSTSNNAKYNASLIKNYKDKNYHEIFSICLYAPLIELENIICYYRAMYEVNVSKQAPHIQEIKQKNAYQQYDLSKIQDILIFSDDYINQLNDGNIHKVMLKQMYDNHNIVRDFMNKWEVYVNDTTLTLVIHIETQTMVYYTLDSIEYSSEKEEYYRIHYPLMYNLSFISSIDQLKDLANNVHSSKYITAILSLLLQCNSFCKYAKTNGQCLKPKSNYTDCVSNIIDPHYRKRHTTGYINPSNNDIKKLYEHPTYRGFYTALHSPIINTHFSKVKEEISKYNVIISNIVSYINNYDNKFKAISGLAFNPDSTQPSGTPKDDTLLHSPSIILSYAEQFIKSAANGLAVDKNLASFSFSTSTDSTSTNNEKKQTESKEITPSFKYLYNYVSILSTYYRLFKKLTITPETSNQFSMANKTVSKALSFLIETPLEHTLESCIDLWPSDFPLKNDSLYNSIQETLSYFLSSIYILDKFSCANSSFPKIDALQKIKKSYEDPEQSQQDANTLLTLFGQDQFIPVHNSTIWMYAHSIFKKKSNGYTTIEKILSVSKKIEEYHTKSKKPHITSNKTINDINNTTNKKFNKLSKNASTVAKHMQLGHIRSSLDFINVAYTISEIYDKSTDMENHYKKHEYLAAFDDFISIVKDSEEVLKMGVKSTKYSIKSVKELLSEVPGNLQKETSKALAKHKHKLKLKPIKVPDSCTGIIDAIKETRTVMPMKKQIAMSLTFVMKNFALSYLAIYSIGEDIKRYRSNNNTLSTKIYLALDIFSHSVDVLPLITKLIVKTRFITEAWQKAILEIAEKMIIKFLEEVLIKIAGKIILQTILLSLDIVAGPIGVAIMILIDISLYIWDHFFKSPDQTSFGIWLSETMWGHTKRGHFNIKKADNPTLYENIYFKIVHHMRILADENYQIHYANKDQAKDKSGILSNITDDFNDSFNTWLKHYNKKDQQDILTTTKNNISKQLLYTYRR